MKNIFYITIVLFVVVLNSCGVSDAEEKSKKHLTDSLVAEQLLEKVESILSKQEKEYKNLINDSTFKDLFNAFCPGDTSHNPPFCSFKKYPFDTVITKKKDTLIYFFKVSNVCCKKYYPNYTLNQDTLILSYNFCGGECDCDCDYYLTYKIPTKKYKFKHIVLRTDQLLERNTN